MLKTWISTNEQNQWKHEELDKIIKLESKEILELTGVRKQTIDGFGGCFNELGYIALQSLAADKQEQVLLALFDEEKGCNFNFCRIPIGASDYAEQWYSHDEHDGDYSMDKFSIERDFKYLIPYIRQAQRHKPDLGFFASPWSPPVWMKHPKAYNYGTLVMKKEILDAYALYFKKFIEAYETAGIPISQVHLQNEPFADQKFPSCLWSAEQFRVFIRDYIGPLFEKEKIDAEIWFGTLNGPTQMNFTPAGIQLQSYDAYVDHVLFDDEARRHITGIGYQWAGQHVIQRTHESFPELKLMQTENECGDGSNSWEYARYVFNLIRHYLGNGANSYIYWNMILENGGKSTWGWTQNTLISVFPEKGDFLFNPEYYLMKHFAHFIQPGAVRLETKGHFSGNSLVFENPDGRLILVVSNSLQRAREFTFKHGKEEFTVTLEPQSFHTFEIEPQAQTN